MSRCPSSVELHRSFTEPDAVIQAHVRGCEICRREQTAVTSLSALADDVAFEPLDHASVEALRVRLAAAVHVTPQVPPRRDVRFIAVVAIAAAAVTAILLSTPTPQPDVVALPSVPVSPRPSHPPAPPQQIETRAFSDGRMSFVVPTLTVRELRVQIGDEEVHGTNAQFELIARGGVLQRVLVTAGHVVLQRANEDRTVVRAGEVWTPAPPIASLEPSTPVVERKTRVVERKTRVVEFEPDLSFEAAVVTTSTVATPTPTAFTEGWRAFRRGDFDAAAEAFERATEEHGPLHEDALYWRAVTALRRGRRAESDALLRELLDTYPDSRRIEEVERLLKSVR